MSRANADVVVIGGGIVGAAIAHQIVARSDHTVVVCEKGSAPGEGSTGASSSIVRVRYSHPEVVRLAVSCLDAWNSWDRFVGGTTTARFEACGGLWIDTGEPAAVSAEAERMGAAGAEVEIVDHPSRLHAALAGCVVPLDLDVDTEHECRDGTAFLFEPGAGWVDPMAALSDLLTAAEAGGAELRYRTRVTGILRDGHGVVGVETAGGDRIGAALVVNAAGPWAPEIDRLAGMKLGWTLAPTRIQTVYVETPPGADRLPIVFDRPTGIYLRPNGATTMVGGVRESDELERVPEPDRFVRTPDAGFRDRMMAALGHRCPGLTVTGPTSGIAGLYTINREDVHPVVGSAAPGYFVASGFSGHGFKLAPMIGAMAARQITAGASAWDPDVSPELFAVDREPFSPEARSVLA